ncbi:MAG: hypothetical protein UX44_C0005G0009 [candidate division WWE3 bacterium GW2011_GWA1_46_21]|uniref:EfeO-type cupredoxin-like domain-containing protein n=2 Tax=Katanobacteria TaxID=422282 RepID=A0A0G1PFJ6_UNCKA|nr:MAG: hypothetical protein UX44_C0005G0009 [candidate division WWE3 bacterium GW2011_GWA1_46_21]KKU51482.1 MAG: hypothetical protein UX73_C0001G0014 [candidate division WWE3 bacterium GW2011_GWC1_47_10]
MNQKSTTIVVLLIVVTLIAGGLFLVRKNLQQKIPTQTTQEAEKQPEVVGNKEEVITPEENSTEASIPAMVEKVVAVTYNNEGFSPATVTVKVGDKVKWVNESSNDMWVASAFHPTHEVYPEFDELKAVPKGETYEFVFDRVGTWAYHNHVKATDTGKVTVEAKESQ